MISYEHAVEIIDRACPPLVGRALGHDDLEPGMYVGEFRAQIGVPPFDNAAMDGYAIRARDTRSANADDPAVLRIVAVRMAGDSTDSAPLESGQAIEIATGAPLPAGADAVIPVERTTLNNDGGEISIDHAVTTGANVRLTAQDFAQGQTLIAAGTRLEPHHLLPAHAGISGGPGTRIDVANPPACAIVATGSEVSDDYRDALVRDINSPYLAAALQSLGMPCVARLRVSDDASDIESALAGCLDSGARVILTTGGVSVGRRDLLSGVLGAMGAEILFHKVAIRPGKPVLLARLGGKAGSLVFGLPGNPVAAAVGFRLFVVRALLALSGATPEKPLRARLLTPVRQRPSLSFFAKARATVNRDAMLEVALLPGQESFKVAPMADANCWAHIRPGDGELRAGALIDIVPMLPAGFPADGG